MNFGKLPSTILVESRVHPLILFGEELTHSGDYQETLDASVLAVNGWGLTKLFLCPRRTTIPTRGGAGVIDWAQLSIWSLRSQSKCLPRVFTWIFIPSTNSERTPWRTHSNDIIPRVSHCLSPSRGDWSRQFRLRVPFIYHYCKRI